MAEWRILRGWTSEELRERLDRLSTAVSEFERPEDEMGAAHGWRHYHSEALIATETGHDDYFDRARAAVANYRFSDPAIVVAHFDPDLPLCDRRLLLEIQIWGLHYLCPVIVSRVRDEPDAFGFRYDTLDGHIERGLEWFTVSRNDAGEIRFRIEARWQPGELPNWWTRLGFALLAEPYQRRWHIHAHRRMSLLAHYGSPHRPAKDAAGLAHQGVNVTFTYHHPEKRRAMTATTLTSILALGAITGMRSMSGPATLALRQAGPLRRVVPLLAAGEMVADKTGLLGDRTAPVPLAGRGVMGAVIGGLLARSQGTNLLLGVGLGAGAAVLAAYSALWIRKRLPFTDASGGLLEDALVVAIGAWSASALDQSAGEGSEGVEGLTEGSTAT